MTQKVAPAQSSVSAVLDGTVEDSMGAVIRGATVHLAPAAASGPDAKAGETDARGAFHLSAMPGNYVLTVEAEGFKTFTGPILSLKTRSPTSFTVHMQVAGLPEEIDVLPDASRDASSPGDLTGTTYLEARELALLSNDPGTLQRQLDALAGGTAHILVDGFSGGRLPPKATIRAIRINSNAFSTYYSDFGLGRVEVETKPGTDRLHGTLNLSGTDRPFDAPNPYTPLQPPFYDFQQDGSLSGPLGRKTSFLLSDAVESLANQSVVNAADPAAPETTLSTAVASPQHTNTFSLRVDQQFSPTHSAYVREEWSRTTITNSGIVPLLLPSAAFGLSTTTNAFQIADTLVLGPHAVNQARFQYLRTRLRQDPNSLLPSVLVQSSFQDGGNPAQQLRDNLDSYEVQDFVDLDRGSHAVRAGFRLRPLRVSNSSTAGFNGQYIFASAAAYQAGRPMQYSQTLGQPGATLTMEDVAVFAEDDWKLRPNLTLSYGLRFESQTAVPDHSDPAPRMALSWAVHPRAAHPPAVTLRFGYGLFYDRFPAAQLIQAIRQNGKREVALIVKDPSFNPQGPPPGATLADAAPTIYQVDPQLKSSYAQAAQFTAVRSMGRFGAFSANLQYEHNAHNYLTRNANAPLPGTFDPNDPDSGIRPLGSGINVYQFAAASNGNLERFYVNYRLQLGRRLFAFGAYSADRIYSESDGIDRFPSNSYDIRQDYARSAMNHSQNCTVNLNAVLPWGVTLSPFIGYHSGAPFDVTTGTDLNGDTIYNDRPAAGTGAGANVRTALGSFNVMPSAGEAPVQRNLGTAPGYLILLLKAEREWHLGPRPPVAAVAGGGTATSRPERPWVFDLGVEAQNLTNHNNPGPPVGVLSAQICDAAGAVPCACTPGAGAACPLVPSQYFGHSLSLANDITPITAANRTIFLHTSFSW